MVDEIEEFQLIKLQFTFKYFQKSKFLLKLKVVNETKFPSIYFEFCTTAQVKTMKLLSKLLSNLIKKIELNLDTAVGT